MALNIDPKIIQQATLCKKGHSCLKDGGRPECRIDEMIGSSVFFTCMEEPSSCVYQTSFGFSFMCTCPVRQAIFRKYKI